MLSHRVLFSWIVVMLGCGMTIAQEASILQLPETLSNDAYLHWSKLVVNEGSLTVFGTNQSTSEVVTWTPGDGLHVVPGSAGKTLRLVSPEGERIVVVSGSPSLQSLVNVATGQVDPLAARPPPEGYSAISTVAHGFLGNGRLLRLSESRPLAGFGNKVQAWILNPNDMTEVEVPASSPAGTALTLAGNAIFFSSGTTRRIMGRGFSSLWFTDDDGFSKEVGPYPNYAVLQGPPSPCASHQGQSGGTTSFRAENAGQSWRGESWEQRLPGRQPASKRSLQSRLQNA